MSHVVSCPLPSTADKPLVKHYSGRCGLVYSDLCLRRCGKDGRDQHHIATLQEFLFSVQVVVDVIFRKCKRNQKH